MTAALVAIFCLILGVVCGLLFGRATNAPYQEAQALKESLELVQSEFDKYKSEVTQHFTKTAELVNSMTENYRNVHTHLAGGAQALCSGALQLESMNDKEALEAKAEEVTETAPAEEAAAMTETAAAANDDAATTTEAVAEASTTDATVDISSDKTEVEQFKVDTDTVASSEATIDAETKPEEKVPAELIADAATATDKTQGENRIH